MRMWNRALVGNTGSAEDYKVICLHRLHMTHQAIDLGSNAVGN